MSLRGVWAWLTSLTWPNRIGLTVIVLAVIGAGGWRAWKAWAMAGPKHHFPPGARLVYHFDLASSSASDFAEALQGGGLGGDLLGLKQNLQTGTRGELIVVVLQRGRKQVDLAFRLESPAVSLISNGGQMAEQEKKVAHDLNQWIFAEADLEGRIDSLRLSPETAPVSAGFARAMLAASQFLLPGDAGADSVGWEGEEDDPAGRAIVRYERVDEKSGWTTWRLHKKRVRYLVPDRDPTDTGETALSITPEGGLDATVDVYRGRLVSLSGVEKSTVRMQKKTVASTESTLEMKLLREETVAEDEREKLLAESRQRALVSQASSLRSSESGEAALQRTALGDMTLDQLLNELAAAEKAPKGEVNETALYLKFRALVYLQPATATKLGERLQKARADSAAMRQC